MDPKDVPPRLEIPAVDLSPSQEVKRSRRLIATAGLVFLFCMLIVGFAIYTRFQNTNLKVQRQKEINLALKHQTNQNRQVLTRVLCFAYLQSLSQDMTLAQRKRVQKFYDGEFAILNTTSTNCISKGGPP